VQACVLPALGGSQTAANGRQEWARFGYMHLSLCNRVALTGRGLGQDRNEAAGVNNEHLAAHTFFVCSRVGSPTVRSQLGSGQQILAAPQPKRRDEGA
jgi:hypothetical protein